MRASRHPDALPVLLAAVRHRADRGRTGRRRCSRRRTSRPTAAGCARKGWTAATLLDHPQRLLQPLVRTVPGDRTSPLRPASWDEALDADRRRHPRAPSSAYGHDGVGCFGGGGLTNEKAYAFGKFARVALRTAMIDYNGRFCMSSAATAGNRAFGIDRGLPFPLADLAEAEAILLVGSNPAATMPPAMQYFDAGRAAGATHIVVDPRRTATAAGSSAAPAAAARHRPRAGQRPAAPRDPGGPGRRGLHRRAHPRLRGGQGRRRVLLAGSGGADHRGPGGRPARHRAHPGRAPSRR